jgi:NAD(P)-dependent dehydrogenase (short-subunit alcohol dehydrogenase family)/peroxiredoxin
LRDRIDEIRGRGAELVLVGSGARHFAAAFREDKGLDCPVLVDPDLRAYRAAGLRRGRVELLSPRLPVNAARAFSKGFRQTSVQGDPWQLGGVFVIRPTGDLTYRYVSREAGDHPPVDDVLAALSETATTLSEGAATPALEAWLGRGLSLVVDPTIVFSFDRIGYRIHSLAFRAADLDVDLASKRCLVTGANSGIGYEAALALADLGAEVELLCRSRERGTAAVEQIQKQTGNRRVGLQEIDLSNLASIRAGAARLGERPIDVLVHNAGLLPPERTLTEDGLELTWALHVVGPHLLTRLLRPALEKSSDARVIWVSSGGMYTQRLHLDDPNWEKRDYDGVIAYAETKRAQVVLAELWAAALHGTSVAVNSMHPGWAETPGVERSLPGFFRLTRPLLRTPAEGADTVVWLAAFERANRYRGCFFFDRKPRRTHLLPFTRESEGDRHRLWEVCEKLTAGAEGEGPVSPGGEPAGAQ